MKVWTDQDRNTYRATLEHEAAHYAAAIHVRAGVYEVEIRSPRTTKDYLGGINAAAVHPWADAVLRLAGSVWNVQHLGMAPAMSDIHSAKSWLSGTGCTFDSLERFVGDFLQDQQHNVRRLADRIDRDLPKTGILRGRTLNRITDDFTQIIPQIERHEMPAARYRPQRSHWMKARTGIL